MLIETSGEITPENEETEPKRKQCPDVDMVMEVKSNARKNNTA